MRLETANQYELSESTLFKIETINTLKATFVSASVLLHDTYPDIQFTCN